MARSFLYRNHSRGGRAAGKKNSSLHTVTEESESQHFSERPVIDARSCQSHVYMLAAGNGPRGMMHA